MGKKENRTNQRTLVPVCDERTQGGQWMLEKLNFQTRTVNRWTSVLWQMWTHRHLSFSSRDNKFRCFEEQSHKRPQYWLPHRSCKVLHWPHSSLGLQYSYWMFRQASWYWSFLSAFLLRWQWFECNFGENMPDHFSLITM